MAPKTQHIQQTNPLYSNQKSIKQKHKQYQNAIKTKTNLPRKIKNNNRHKAEESYYLSKRSPSTGITEEYRLPNTFRRK